MPKLKVPATLAAPSSRKDAARTCLPATQTCFPPPSGTSRQDKEHTPSRPRAGLGDSGTGTGVFQEQIVIAIEFQTEEARGADETARAIDRGRVDVEVGSVEDGVRGQADRREDLPRVGLRGVEAGHRTRRIGQCAERPEVDVEFIGRTQAADIPRATGHIDQVPRVGLSGCAGQAEDLPVVIAAARQSQAVGQGERAERVARSECAADGGGPADRAAAAQRGSALHGRRTADRAVDNQGAGTHRSRAGVGVACCDGERARADFCHTAGTS